MHLQQVHGLTLAFSIIFKWNKTSEIGNITNFCLILLDAPHMRWIFPHLLVTFPCTSMSIFKKLPFVESCRWGRKQNFLNNPGLFWPKNLEVNLEAMYLWWPTLLQIVLFLLLFWVHSILNPNLFTPSKIVPYGTMRILKYENLYDVFTH